MTGLTSAQLVMARDMSEGDLQGLVAERDDSLVAMLGGLYYHTRRSEQSVHGWPDLAIWTPRRLDTLVLTELKSMTGIWSTAQRRWQDVLRFVRYLEYYAWTPEDWYSGTIEEVLIHGRQG